VPTRNASNRATSTAARLALGLPDDKPIVFVRVPVNFEEPRKRASAYLREIVAALQDEVVFAAFGHNAQEIPGMIGLGYHLKAHKLGQVYQAADISSAPPPRRPSAKTVMEAQLCGLPVVAFKAGGVEESCATRSRASWSATAARPRPSPRSGPCPPTSAS